MKTTTWYETSAWNEDIHPVQVLSETAKTVMVAGLSGGRLPRRKLKDRHLHRTLEEAHLFVLQRLDDNVEAYGRALQKAIDRRAAFRTKLMQGETT